MRKFTRVEKQILHNINSNAENDREALNRIIDTLITERDAGANSLDEMDRIDDLLETRNKLSAVSVCIDNATGAPL